MSEEPQKHAVAVVRCILTAKKLARTTEQGIYLFCKECACEEFFSWEEILPRTVVAQATKEEES